MGFFKNLFEKKTCDICGGEIGLLGNRKLEDGNCCKECAKKLSPWFTERKHSTIEEIKRQLESREANKKDVAAFNVSRSYGRDMKVLIDENARKFMVTRADNLENANPDVLDFSQVVSCDVDVRESRNEVYRRVQDEDGETKNVSYSPRRYKYSYDFQMKIAMNHPYIDEIEFSLSNGYFRVEASDGYDSLTSIFFGSSRDEGEGSVNPPTASDKRSNDDYRRYDQWAQEIRQILLSKPEPKAAPYAAMIANYEKAEQELAAAKASGDRDRQFMARNNQLAAMGAMKEAFDRDPQGAIAAGVMDVLKKYNQDGGAPAQAAAPARGTVTCPWCGAETTDGKFCENCGGSLKG